MYNIKLNELETIIKIFDNIYIKQDINEKYTTIILTNQRLLFLDHLIPNEGLEMLRVSKGINYLKEMDVYFEVNLSDINNVVEDEYYKITLKNKMYFEFNEQELYNLIKENIQ